MSDKLLEVVQDHTSLVQALQFILEAAETKKLPPYGVFFLYSMTTFLMIGLRVYLSWLPERSILN